MHTREEAWLGINPRKNIPAIKKPKVSKQLHTSSFVAFQEQFPAPRNRLSEMTWIKLLPSWKRVLGVDPESPSDSASMNIPTLYMGNEDSEDRKALSNVTKQNCK